MSSLHEEESDDSSYSSSKTLSDKFVNKDNISHHWMIYFTQKVQHYLMMLLRKTSRESFIVNVIGKGTFSNNSDKIHQFFCTIIIYIF